MRRRLADFWLLMSEKSIKKRERTKNELDHNHNHKLTHNAYKHEPLSGYQVYVSCLYWDTSREANLDPLID
jgi:hypothetical protein